MKLLASTMAEQGKRKANWLQSLAETLEDDIEESYRLNQQFIELYESSQYSQAIALFCTLCHETCGTGVLARSRLAGWRDRPHHEKKLNIFFGNP